MNTDGQTLLRQYLEQVQHTMHQAQHSPQEIEIVLDALEEQLEERAPKPLTPKQARHILASMPPPASYADTDKPKPSHLQPAPQPTRNPLGILSIILCLGTILLLMVLTVVAEATQISLEESGGALLLMGLGSAMVAGFFARQTSIGKFGLYGSAMILGLCLLMSQV